MEEVFDVVFTFKLIINYYLRNSLYKKNYFVKWARVIRLYIINITVLAIKEDGNKGIGK